MRLHGVACPMRDFKRSLGPDATNPAIIVVPDRLAAHFFFFFFFFFFFSSYSQALG